MNNKENLKKNRHAIVMGVTMGVQRDDLKYDDMTLGGRGMMVQEEMQHDKLDIDTVSTVNRL